MQAILKTLRARVFQPHAAEHGEIVLVQRRIFILPTGAGVLFGVVLLLMLAGSLNFGLSLGLVLTFLLASFGITAMLSTFRNLAGLRISPVRALPVFAGDVAHFNVCLHNPTQAHRYAIHLTRSRAEGDIVDVPAAGHSFACARVPASRRGWLRPGKLTLYTRFPVGLYYAWAFIEFDARCVVYPKPAPPGLPLPASAARHGDHTGRARGVNDFAGLRDYQPGDSPRHIAWKAAARDHGLLTKQFSGQSTAELWLSLDLLPESIDVEEKLSRLTRWVLDAHTAGVPFGLRLPHVTVQIATGERHRERCLEALALHSLEQPPASPP